MEVRSTPRGVPRFSPKRAPEAIQVGKLPVPGPTDDLVAVEVAAVYPAATFPRSGRYPTPMPLPFDGDPEVSTSERELTALQAVEAGERCVMRRWPNGCR